MVAARAKVGKGESGTSADAGHGAEAHEFRNRNSAVLMERFRTSGEAARLGVGHTHYAVLQTLASYAKPREWHLLQGGDRIVSGDVWPTQATIASRIGQTERTVRRALVELSGKGLIEIRRTTIPVQIREGHGLAPAVIRRNAYRVRLPVVCAADGFSETVATAPGPEAPLSLVRPSDPDVLPDRTPTSSPTGHGRPVRPDTDVRSDRTRTSYQPSESSTPSISEKAAAAAASFEEEGEGDRTEEPRSVVLGDGRSVRLGNPPRSGGDGTTRNGSATVEGTGETVAVPPDAWRLLDSGDGSRVVLAERPRGDGSRYWWASVTKEADRRRRDGRTATEEEAPLRPAQVETEEERFRWFDAVRIEPDHVTGERSSSTDSGTVTRIDFVHDGENGVVILKGSQRTRREALKSTCRRPVLVVWTSESDGRRRWECLDVEDGGANAVREEEIPF